MHDIYILRDKIKKYFELRKKHSEVIELGSKKIDNIFWERTGHECELIQIEQDLNNIDEAINKLKNLDNSFIKIEDDKNELERKT